MRALPEEHVGDIDLLESRRPKSPRYGTRQIPPFRQGHPTAAGGDSKGETSLPHPWDQREPAGGVETTREERGRGGGKEFVVRQRRSGDGRGGLHPFRASLPSAIRAIKETGFCGLGRFALSPAHSDLKWLPITHM
ncbi:hypothetical protein BHE74_00011433 [Ensete ventricosum]|nr:hypothetical protein GW17_00021325 [Ensete ventricosum]RWW80239.1 hypothetical protein BHE74_00011433 [Ensete ventricosum]RZR91220.1 hypothetical protein BHM03_00019293 [Ensete ventricosum]